MSGMRLPTTSTLWWVLGGGWRMAALSSCSSGSTQSTAVSGSWISAFSDSSIDEWVCSSKWPLFSKPQRSTISWGLKFQSLKGLTSWLSRKISTAAARIRLGLDPAWAYGQWNSNGSCGSRRQFPGNYGRMTPISSASTWRFLFKKIRIKDPSKSQNCSFFYSKVYTITLYPYLADRPRVDTKTKNRNVC